MLQCHVIIRSRQGVFRSVPSLFLLMSKLVHGQPLKDQVVANFSLIWHFFPCWFAFRVGVNSPSIFKPPPQLCYLGQGHYPWSASNSSSPGFQSTLPELAPGLSACFYCFLWFCLCGLVLCLLLCEGFSEAWGKHLKRGWVSFFSLFWGQDVVTEHHGPGQDMTEVGTCVGSVFTACGLGTEYNLKRHNLSDLSLTRPHLLEFAELPKTVPPIGGSSGQHRIPQRQLQFKPQQNTLANGVYFQASVCVMQGLVGPGLPLNSPYS